jgi:hypothetical protein
MLKKIMKEGNRITFDRVWQPLKKAIPHKKTKK